MGRRDFAGSPPVSTAGVSDAMSRQTRYLELRCPRCSWAEVCGPEDVARWLRGARKLRRRSDPDLGIMYEVFRATAGHLACPECGKKGLGVGPAPEDMTDWPGPKVCSACGKTISPERMEAVPGTTLCAACQRDEELGRAKVEIEYCPQCGAPMKLRPSRSGGLTRYVLVCTGDPPCRPTSSVALAGPTPPPKFSLM